MMKIHDEVAQALCQCPDLYIKQVESKKLRIKEKTLRELLRVRPSLIDRLFEIDFEIFSEWSEYFDDEVSDRNEIYHFMEQRYGKEDSFAKILERPQLWRNFLFYVDYDRKREKLTQLLAEDNFDLALDFIKYFEEELLLEEKDCEKVFNAFWASGRDDDEEILPMCCPADYLFRRGWWNSDFLYDFIYDQFVLEDVPEEAGCQQDNVDKTIKEAIRKIMSYEAGQVALESLEDENINKFIAEILAEK